MLQLGFRLGEERYALACAQIIEVVPRTHLRQIPQAPPFVAGVMDFRGQLTPVIDLCQLVLGRPANDRLSTRIILVQHQAAGGHLLLGLLAEHVCETLALDNASFADSGIHNQGAPYLGGMARDQGELVQQVVLAELLPANVTELLAGHTP